VWNWLDGQGLGSIKVVLVPLLVIFAATPLLVIACLLLVALMMAPAMVEMVATRRFPALEAKRGGSWWRSVWVSLGSTLVALVILIVSIPLWFIPPIILVLPPLIWGWLTYRVMTFDALSLHASPAESRELVKAHRGPLLVMGLICGYLGAAPGLVWASGAVFVVFFPFLVPVAIWLYTLVFAFSSLWFTHYCLQALTDMRASAAEHETQVVQPVTASEPVVASPAPILLPPA
jgi:Etoposide-induced protein 2.4 (EI24)